MQRTFRGFLLACAGLGPLSAHAEIVEIAWSDQGRFVQEFTVAPGKFAEACGKLQRGDAVAWRFEAGGPLDFNIHFHEGKAVRYPARRKSVAAARGQLKVALDQDYCWMWTNTSAQPVDLRLTLTR
jgi:hypothetical protein